MKLSRTTILIIISGVFAIAAAGLFMRYSGQTDEQAQLNEKLNTAQTRLRTSQSVQHTDKQTELETQLSDAKLQLEEVKAPFSELAGSTTAINTLLDVAEANGLDVTVIKSPGLTESKSEGLTFWIMPLKAKVQGNMSDLVSFLIDLDRSLETGIIKSVTTGDNASAEIELTVYTYRGD